MSRRTLAEFEPLLAGEKTLLDGLASGESVPIGGKTVPPADAGEERQLRGEFLRYLLLGGCEALDDCDAYVHEKGVRLAGALITGVLDMEGCRIPRDIVLFSCRFETAPVLRSAVIDNLFLNHSTLPGLHADGLEAKGGVFLLDVQAAEVRLLGAKLGAYLDCTSACLTAGQSGFALVADRLEAKGGVFLRRIQVDGEVRLLGAKLGGNLSCTDACLTAVQGGFALSADGLETKGGVYLCGIQVDGEVRLLGGRFGGNLDCSDARLTVLRADGVRVEGAFILRDKARITNVLDLTGTEIAMLDDASDCWPPAGGLLLDRCQYGAITGGPVTAEERIKWLSLQDESRWGKDFWPQPWEQCAKVLREMGHREEARKVLIEKEKRQRADRRKGYWFGWRWLSWLADFLMCATVAYGHKPLRAFIWLLAFWLIGVGVFSNAAQRHAIKPNDVRIIRAAEWVACAPDYQPDVSLGQPAARNKTGISQLECFLDQPEAASYPKFNALVYSADTLLPVVAMEMQSYWIPDDSDRGVGMWARRFLWLQIIAGWALSLLAVAGFSGLIKSD